LVPSGKSKGDFLKEGEAISASKKEGGGSVNARPKEMTEREMLEKEEPGTKRALTSECSFTDEKKKHIIIRTQKKRGTECHIWGEGAKLVLQ